jgi:hypothetical protein
LEWGGVSEPDIGRHSMHVAQASGMVSVQAECSISAAMVLMESRAHVTGQSLEQIALAVINRETSFP